MSMGDYHGDEDEIEGDIQRRKRLYDEEHADERDEDY